MGPLRLIVARTEAQFAAAERLRLQVYCAEEGMLPAAALRRPRDIDRRGFADTTAQLLAYAGEEPVGAVRLDAAPSLALESKFVLGGFDEPGTVLAEITGYCVRRAFRGTAVTPALFSGLHVESARLGVTHWVAAANTETDCPEDAAIAYQLIRQRGLASAVFRAQARSVSRPPANPARFVYTPEQRARARSGELDGLKLPRTLALFAAKMGARYIGSPAYDPVFNVFAAPLAVAIRANPAPYHFSGIPLAPRIERHIRNLDPTGEIGI